MSKKGKTRLPFSHFQNKGGDGGARIAFVHRGRQSQTKIKVPAAPLTKLQCRLILIIYIFQAFCLLSCCLVEIW